MDIVRFVSEVCLDSGLSVDIQEEIVEGRVCANVFVRPEKEKPPQEIMLQSHLDTGLPGEFSEWDKTGNNPFNPSIHGDLLYGLGASQAKLDFLCKLEAIRQSGSQICTKTPFVLVGTFGIESRMAGSMKLIRRKKVNATKAFIGQPTSLNLATAGPGTAVVEITIPFSKEEKDYHFKHDMMESSYTQSKMFYGKAAHFSQPHLGDNAIVKMLDYLDNLPEGIAIMEMDGGVNFNSVPSHSILEIDVVDGFKDSIISKLKKVKEAIKVFEKEFPKYPDEYFEPNHSTLNIGRVKTVQNHIKLSGTCRVTPSVKKDIYEEWIKQLRDSCEAVGASIIISDYKQPFETPTDSDFIKDSFELLKEVNSSSQLIKHETTTEASLFNRVGVDCVVFGPGQGAGNIHAPNEFVKIEELDKASEFYRKVLERFCL